MPRQAKKTATVQRTDAAPRSLRVRVYNSDSKKTALHCGDAVSLDTVPNALRLPAPTIVKLLPGRRAVVNYWVHNARDGTHRMESTEMSARHMRTAAPTFAIGNVVRVKKKAPLVLVDVGTKGKLIGGDGNSWHVAFRVERVNGVELDAPLNVSQEGVPGEALEFVQEEESEGDEQESEESSSASVSDHVQGGESEWGTFGPGASTLTSTLWKQSPVTVAPSASGRVSVAQTAVGQTPVSCASSVTRSTITQHLTPAHVSALRAVGASAAQVCVMDMDATYYTLSPDAAARLFKQRQASFQ